MNLKMKTRLKKSEIKKYKRIMNRLYDRFGGIWQENENMIIIQNISGGATIEFLYDYDEYDTLGIPQINVYCSNYEFKKDIENYILELEIMFLK